MDTAFYEYTRDFSDRQMFSFDSHNCCSYHFHGQFEFTFVTKDFYNVTINGRTERLGPGEIAFSDSFDAHMLRPETPESACTVITIPNRYLDGFTKLKKGRIFKENFIRDPQVSTVFENFLAVLKSADAENVFLLSGLLQSLLGLITEAVPLESSERAESRDFMRRVLFYFEQHLTDEISLEKISAAFGYSQTYFSALFHRSFQCNFRNYIGDLRARYAARLIQEGSPILTAALDAGFPSIPTFYRAYGRVFGAPPSASFKK